MILHRFIVSVCCFVIFMGTACASISAREGGPVVPDEWSVEEAVGFALANSPDTAITRQRIHAAQATVEQATAAFYPRVDLGVSYGQTNNPMYSFGNILNQGAFDQSIDFNDP